MVFPWYPLFLWYTPLNILKSDHVSAQATALEADAEADAASPTLFFAKLPEQSGGRGIQVLRREDGASAGWFGWEKMGKLEGKAGKTLENQ